MSSCMFPLDSLQGPQPAKRVSLTFDLREKLDEEDIILMARAIPEILEKKHEVEWQILLKIPRK